MLSNETPWLADASTALANRFLCLQTFESFLGREDRGLEERLGLELPNILNWAIAGWKRLKARGKFIQPASGDGISEELRELSSRISTFRDDALILGANYRETIVHTYVAWILYCRYNGDKNFGTTRSLARDLRTIVPRLDCHKVTTIKDTNTFMDRKYKLFTGFRLNDEYRSIVVTTLKNEGESFKLVEQLPEPPSSHPVAGLPPPRPSADPS